MVYYLTFFNGQLIFQRAMIMEASQIIDLFQKFATNPNAKNVYGVHEGAQEYIQSAISTIETIRKKNSNLNPGFIDGNPNFIEVGYQGNTFKLRTLYDIVGWIFSVVGTAPSGAKRDNYYYPLVMIASVFCRKLVPDIKYQTSDGQTLTKGAPDVWMAMWFEQKVNNKLVTRVVLGATLDRPTSSIKNSTKEFRKNLLKDAEILGDTTAPVKLKNPSNRGQDFGHCAESYPLLFIRSLPKNPDEILKNASGIAVNTQNLYNATSCTIPSYTEVKKGNKILPPCDNCKYLMEGFTQANFT